MTGVLSLSLGAVIGTILALTGAGGGILAVPLLVFGLHLTMAQAAPVGLIAVGAASAFGAALGLREGLVRYRAAMLIGAVGMLLAPLGVRLAHMIPNTPLMVAFSLLLAWVAWRIFIRARGDTADEARTLAAMPCMLDPAEGRLTWTRPRALALGGTGVLSGLLSGLLGAGGGFVIVPALSRFTNVATGGILATSLAVIALVSVGGVVGAALHGAVVWPVALPFAAGAILAMLAGRRLAARVAGARLQQGFALVSAAVALLLLARAAGGLAM